MHATGDMAMPEQVPVQYVAMLLHTTALCVSMYSAKLLVCCCSDWTYMLEPHLHELMLQSPHRTLDPDEADFFYVPVYASCYMHPVHGWADYPWFYSDRWAQATR